MRSSRFRRSDHPNFAPAKLHASSSGGQVAGDMPNEVRPERGGLAQAPADPGGGGRDVRVVERAQGHGFEDTAAGLRRPTRDRYSRRPVWRMRSHRSPTFV